VDNLKKKMTFKVGDRIIVRKNITNGDRFGWTIGMKGTIICIIPWSDDPYQSDIADKCGGVLSFRDGEIEKIEIQATIK